MPLKNRMTIRDSQVPFNLERVLTDIQKNVEEIKEELGSKASRTELENVRSTVEQVRIHGSGQAQQALADLTVMRAQVVKLEMEQASKSAVEATVRQIAEQGRSIRFFWIGLIVTVLIGIFGNMIALAGTLVAIAAFVLHFLGK